MSASLERYTPYTGCRCPAAEARAGPAPPGQALLPAKRDGDTNISPSISPDGRYIAFFAARDLFGFDLYLADAATGKSVKKLANASTTTEFDALSGSTLSVLCVLELLPE